jgi:hypothetical protein
MIGKAPRGRSPPKVFYRTSACVPAGNRLGNFRFTSGGKDYDLYDFLSLHRVSGLLILKDGRIALERYELGNTENTRWMSMSIIKSFTASLVGASVQDGFIKSIDDPLTKYLPRFAGRAAVSA